MEEEEGQEEQVKKEEEEEIFLFDYLVILKYTSHRRGRTRFWFLLPIF